MEIIQEKHQIQHNEHSPFRELSLTTRGEAVSWKRPWQCKGARSGLEVGVHGATGNATITGYEAYTSPETGKYIHREVILSFDRNQVVALRDYLNEQLAKSAPVSMEELEAALAAVGLGETVEAESERANAEYWEDMQ
jgi:hypothetical protein